MTTQATKHTNVHDYIVFLCQERPMSLDEILAAFKEDGIIVQEHEVWRAVSDLLKSNHEVSFLKMTGRRRNAQFSSF